MVQEWKVLDQGFIKYLEKFGNELTIVNAARVSFGKQKTEFDDKDKNLLKYLLKHGHTSPFRHVFFRFHIRAPEFVLRQWFKHVVGCEWSYQLHGWNEISGRYIEMHDFYIPNEWRKQSSDKKQGSDGLITTDHDFHMKYTKYLRDTENLYQEMIEAGVAKEQARIILPLSHYTECIWTVSLQALVHFVNLRDDDHAQYEIREYAKILKDILSQELPNCYHQSSSSSDKKASSSSDSYLL